MEKNKYEVYEIESYWSADTMCDTEKRKYVGTTWATSEEKAVNNVRYRTRGKTTNWQLYDMGKDEAVERCYIAVQVWPPI